MLQVYSAIESLPPIMKDIAVTQPQISPKTILGGLLIAFEGIDGSGKTTMAKRTAEVLQSLGYNAVYLREPTDGPHGRRLREIMVSSEMRDPEAEFELFLLDRREDVLNNINPVLQTGGIVCIDRYYVSSMAYQGALGLDAELIRQENEKFAPVPDIILHYIVPVETALQRINASRKDGANQFEKREYLEKVEQEFNRMNFPQIKTISTTQSLESVFQDTWNAVTDRLNLS
jgi:dTMP kinase